MKFKFISINEDGFHENKMKYIITNNKSNENLGIIFYYKPWKQYVFTQYAQNIVFNNECLLNILEFINKCNQ